MSPEQFDELLQRLSQIESTLDQLLDCQAAKDWYTTAEVARMLQRAEFTVREWCRRGRVKAKKQQSARGKHAAWVIPHEELVRIQEQGLLAQTSE